MRSAFTYAATIISVSSLLGCDQTFNPNGPYEEKLVVYAVLSTHSDTQYVRVYSSYAATNPPSSPLDIQVPDAQVTISQGTRTFRFRDTTIVSKEESSKTRNVGAFVAYSFPLEQGLPYQLSVSSPTHGQVTAQATSLYRGSMFVEREPRLPAPSTDVTALVTLGPTTRAYIVRLYLDYEALVQNVWVRKRIEVPQDVRPASGSTEMELIYPKPIPRGSAMSGDLANAERATFTVSAYRRVISQLNEEFPTGTLQLKQAVFVLTQLDDVFYAYYSTVHGFPGPGTLRLDEPDYTNIKGGLGIFAMSAETITTVDLTDD